MYITKDIWNKILELKKLFEEADIREEHELTVLRQEMWEEWKFEAYGGDVDTS